MPTFERPDTSVLPKTVPPNPTAMRNILQILTVATFILLAFTQCSRDCFKSEACHLEGEAGPCDALVYGYYYDQQEKRCVEFGWGGCGGVRPFATMLECEQQCDCG